MDKETYLLLVLSDSNLPTGSFVASAGLESTATHALFHATPPTTGSAATATGTTGTGSNTDTSTGTGPTGISSSTSSSSILAFLRNSIDTYARSALPFARDAHRITTAYAKNDIADLDVALAALAKIDALYDACTLNHVARRASCAQGVALLSLYARGFTCPPFLLSTGTTIPQGVDSEQEQERDRESRASALVAALKLRVRRGAGGESDDDALGHLPVCWGVLAGALGLSVGEHSLRFLIPRLTHKSARD
jgi:urease accessory protein